MKCHRCANTCKLKEGCSDLPRGWVYITRYWDRHSLVAYCPTCYVLYQEFVDEGFPSKSLLLDIRTRTLQLSSGRLIQLVGAIAEAIKYLDPKPNDKGIKEDPDIEKAIKVLLSTKPGGKE